MDHPVVPVFHHLAKIHKKDTPIKGHPMVADIGSVLQKLGEWVDQYLQPLVTRLPGYIKVATSILKHVNDIYWQNHFPWITLDVKSLYSCIPHSLALDALKFNLSKHSTYDSPLKEFIILSVTFLLQHNYLIFHEFFYVQCLGASMGAIFSQSLYGLVGGILYFFSTEHLYLPYPLVWELHR